MPTIRNWRCIARSGTGDGPAWIVVVLASALIASTAALAQPAPQPAPQPPVPQAPTLQSLPAPDPQENPPPAAMPDAANRPGFLDALGRWLGNSKEAIDLQLRQTQETLETLGSQATGAAKDAAGAAQKAGPVIGLPIAHAINGKQLCALAPNGAPDCQPAADSLCKSKGYGGGKSVEIQSSQRCPSRVWVTGRDDRNRCRTDTFVTRAACQ